MTINLTYSQELVVEHEDGPLLVLAGPGSGKTRVLTERIKRLLEKNNAIHRVLALTFSNKAAGEMSSRLSALSVDKSRVNVSTIHSFCLNVVQQKGRSIGIDITPPILENRSERIQMLYEHARLDDHLYKKIQRCDDNKGIQKLIGSWLDTIKDAKNSLLTADEIDDETEQRAYYHYQEALDSSGYIDFDDVLVLAHRILSTIPQIADYYCRQYAYVCIDEAQDLNLAQYSILETLIRSGHRNIMMVGDPDQSIYGWNGASAQYMNLFRETCSATEILLKENFRSSQAVLEVANNFSVSPEQELFAPIRGEVKLLVGKNEADEARMVISYIQDLVKSGHPDLDTNFGFESVAIVARNRYALAACEHELLSHGIDYQSAEKSTLPAESSAMKAFNLLLKIAENPKDIRRIKRIEKLWKNKITIKNESNGSPTELRSLHELSHLFENELPPPQAQALRIAAESITLDGSIDLTYSLGFLRHNASELADENERYLLDNDIIAWTNAWDDFLRSRPGGRPPHLSSFLTSTSSVQPRGKRPHSISLLTTHASKGLEYDVVAIVGLCQGIFPDYRAKGSQFSEEVRSMYVACTRARRILILSYPRSTYTTWGSIRNQEPSKFLHMAGLV